MTKENLNSCCPGGAERVFYGLSRVYRFTPGKKLKRLQSHGCLKCLRMDKEADERIYRSRHIGMENPFERIRMRWDESKCNHTLIVCIIINDTHNKQSQSRINQSSTYPLRLKYKCYSIQSSLMALLLTRCPSSTL